MRTCYIYMRDNILEVKHKNMYISQKQGQIVDFYMKSHTYANVIQKSNPVDSNNNLKKKADNDRAFIE